MSGISAGKLVNLRRMADDGGRFKMLAIDQRDSLRRALSAALGKAREAISYDDLAMSKEAVTRTLSPLATAVLTDPIYGFPQSVGHIPGRVGILLALEETGYEQAGADGKERKSRLIEGWSVAKAKRAGANAVKLLLYYNPQVSQDALAHQQRLVIQLGQECATHDLPFLLELVTYPLKEVADSMEFARRRPLHVIASAREFSDPKYGVDVLKVEFPADLKHTKEFCHKVFDGKVREPVYGLDEVKDFYKGLNDACGLPWVILSGGVDIQEFLLNLELAVRAGASGFLCGRAIWKDAVPLSADVDKMERFLRTEGAYNFQRANSIAEMARPWFKHPRFEGHHNPELAQGGEQWFQNYRA